MIFLALVLQKPFKSSKSRNHVSCFERQMKEWRDGRFLTLLEGGIAIQHRRIERRSSVHARKVVELAMKGKVKGASRLLSTDSGAMILPQDQMIDGKPVRDVLREKHPTALLQQEGEATAPPHHPMMFDEINGLCILKSALKTEGGAGPSGVDASLWRRMYCSFQSASSELCAALACAARRICSSPVDPEPLRPLTASRLVAIDKCPGVRLIEIGEVSRRVIGEYILTIIHADIQEAVGTHQLCVGQKYSCEAAIHALGSMYEREDTEGVLLIDASNAFNNLNHRATLVNVQRICPAFANVLINTCRADPPYILMVRQSFPGKAPHRETPHHGNIRMP